MILIGNSQNRTKLLVILLTSIIYTQDCFSQNKNFAFNFAFGVGNSGFDIEEEGEDQVNRIYYTMGGLQFHKRLKNKWALQFFPNVGMSGNTRNLSAPIGGITRVKSTSAFINLAIHPKYFISSSTYVSLGPEISYLIWNYGSTFREDERISNRNETEFFNRTNFLLSSSIGWSTKVSESRKKSPVEIDLLWFIEMRLKKGLTNILSQDYFPSSSSTTSTIELVTGFSFASKN